MIPIPGQFSDVGVMGLCSAGRSLVLRLAAMGLRVSLWDASVGRVEEFVARHDGTRGGLVGYADSEDFVESLNTPRRIVVFGPETSLASTSPRAMLREADRLLEYPWHDGDVPFEDLAQLVMTLIFQMA